MNEDCLYDCCPHCEHMQFEGPPNAHRNPCPEGCNDDDDE